MFYSFPVNTFPEAETFEEAKSKLLASIEALQEDPKRWHPCTCTGLVHRYDCPEWVLPF